MSVVLYAKVYDTYPCMCKCVCRYVCACMLSRHVHMCGLFLSVLLFLCMFISSVNASVCIVSDCGLFFCVYVYVCE